MQPKKAVSAYATLYRSFLYGDGKENEDKKTVRELVTNTLFSP